MTRGGVGESLHRLGLELHAWRRVGREGGDAAAERPPLASLVFSLALLLVQASLLGFYLAGAWEERHHSLDARQLYDVLNDDYAGARFNQLARVSSRTVTQKRRIVMLGGTGRQKLVLERWADPTL